MSKTQVKYNSELDVLTVDNTEQEYEKSVTSGDFIIDLNPQGEIRGLEIQNISKITGTDQKQLEKISEAEIETRKTNENILITLKLEIEKQKTTLAAQLQNNQLKA